MEFLADRLVRRSIALEQMEGVVEITPGIAERPV